LASAVASSFRKASDEQRMAMADKSAGAALPWYFIALTKDTSPADRSNNNIEIKKMRNIFKEIIFCLIFIFIGLFGFIGSSFAVCPDQKPSGMIYCNDFEDWTGDADTTPTYPFGTNYPSYWTQHEAVTHIISSCDVGGVSWTSSSGSYFQLHNAYDGAVDPCLGDTGHVGTYNQFGMGAVPYGNNTDFRIMDFIHYGAGDRELFVRFKIRMDPLYKSTTYWVNGTGSPVACIYPHLKLLRFYTGGGGDGIVLYYNGCAANTFNIVFTGEVAWSRNTSAGGSDLMDGNWHTISWWIRLQDTAGSGYGSTKLWIDAADENADTPEGSYANLPFTATDDEFTYGYFLNNFSADYPTGNLRFGLDDIELWDSMPSADIIDIIPPAAPSGLIVI